MGNALAVASALRGSLGTRRSKTAAAERAVADRMGILAEVRLVGGALILLAVVAMILNEVFDAVSIPDTSPWYAIVESLQSTGVAAISLLVVALLVVAAVAIMRILNQSGFGTR